MLSRKFSFVSKSKLQFTNPIKRNYNIASCIAVTSVASVSYLNLKSYSNLKERLAKNKAAKSVIDDISYLNARMLGEDYVDVDNECNYINLKLASIGYNGPKLTVEQLENSKYRNPRFSNLKPFEQSVSHINFVDNRHARSSINGNCIGNEKLLTWLNDRYDHQEIQEAEAEINQNKKKLTQLIWFVCGFIYCICLYTFYG